MPSARSQSRFSSFATLAPLIDPFLNLSQIKNQIQNHFKFQKFNLEDYKPRFNFEIESSQYILKTATSKIELESAFNLRFQIFYSKKNSPLLDIDLYDSMCDHLVIISKQDQKVIGTYRLNLSSQFSDFYSQSEFDLKSFTLPYNNFVELGRACIHENHRNGSVISMLWRGIYLYMKKSNADIVFGCSSLKKLTPTQAVLVYKYFQQQKIINTKYQIRPHLSYQVPFFTETQSEYNNELTSDQIQLAESLIPSLLKAYLKVGAEIISEPAFDSDMNCIDFLTCLKTTKLAERYDKFLNR